MLATPLNAPLLFGPDPWNQPGARGLLDTPLCCATGRYIAACAVVPESFTVCHGSVASMRHRPETSNRGCAPRPG